MFIHQVCTAFDKANIPYAVAGGLAVALHGAVRGTVDVDIVIRWNLHNLQKIERVLQDLRLISLLPITAENIFNFRDEYIQNRNLIAWNFYDPTNPLNQVDIIINYDLSQAKVKKIKTPSGTIKILARADLIQMKKSSGRPQDMADVQALEML